MFNPFRRKKPHLWRNPLTGHYFDPVVLHAELSALPSPPNTASLRPLLGMRQVVILNGSGYAETQVKDAYLDFLSYLEKKGLTESDSPTDVPPTGVRGD